MSGHKKNLSVLLILAYDKNKPMLLSILNPIYHFNDQLTSRIFDLVNSVQGILITAGVDVLKLALLSDAQIRMLCENKVNALAADALAPCVARASAAMLLTMQDKCIFLFHQGEFQQSVPSVMRNGTKYNIKNCFLLSYEKKSAQKGLTLKLNLYFPLTCGSVWKMLYVGIISKIIFMLIYKENFINLCLIL